MIGRTEPTVALVVAHPDDDAYGIAGSVALHDADPGFRFVLVHATDGENGQIAPGVDVPDGDLGIVRRAECVAAWRRHGTVPDRHDWLGHPDGGLAALPVNLLRDEIAAVLRAEQPAVVVTFGPDGITGHPDHIAVGAATDEAFHLVRAEGGPGLERLLHGALRDSVFARYQRRREAAGLPAWDPTAVYHLRGVPDELIDVDVDTAAVADRVVAGLREHRSQRHVIFEGPDERWPRLVSREYLVMAWPRRTGPPLTDIFEGL